MRLLDIGPNRTFLRLIGNRDKRKGIIADMADWTSSILMLAGAALLAGGLYLLRTGKNRKQGWLMLVAAAVMFANVGIWSIPLPQGEIPGAQENPE